MSRKDKSLGDTVFLQCLSGCFILKGGISMNKEWTKVILAAILEVFWVIGLTHSNNLFQWTLTIFLIVASNYLMVSATSKLPTGTVYAVFVGLGTVGIVLSDALFFGATLNWLKLLLILLLVSGVVGLKLLTPEKNVTEEN